jgi:hypothetical protein
MWKCVFGFTIFQNVDFFDVLMWKCEDVIFV